MIITLIGYRGCGKSTLAPLVAEQFGAPWADADTVLEERTGRQIRDIFATEGEAYFRELERDLLVQLLQQPALVLATGGGAILRADTRSDIRAAGPAIWLQAEPATLARRIAGDPDSIVRRPALTDLPLLPEVTRVLAERAPLYQETATLVLQTEQHTMEELVAAIVAHARHWPTENRP